jgi:hypothetical protein
MGFFMQWFSKNFRRWKLYRDAEALMVMHAGVKSGLSIRSLVKMSPRIRRLCNDAGVL